VYFLERAKDPHAIVVHCPLHHSHSAACYRAGPRSLRAMKNAFAISYADLVSG